jgi:hypothetical protein
MPGLPVNRLPATGSKGVCMDLMWFYDEGPEKYRDFRQQVQALEKEHLETRTALKATQTAQKADPGNPPSRPG